MSPRVSSVASRTSESGPRTGVSAVDPSEESGVVADWIASGFLVARAVLPDAAPAGHAEAAARGRLRDAIESAVELTLAMRGALPPNVAVDVAVHEMAQDELFRLRALGAKGLGILLPDLGRLVDADGVLDTADSETLRVWRRLADTEQVALLLQESDRRWSLLAPTAIGSWIASAASDRSSDVHADARHDDLEFDAEEFILLDEVAPQSFDESDEVDVASLVAAAASQERPSARESVRGPTFFHANTTDDEDACVMRDDLDAESDLEGSDDHPDEGLPGQQMLPLASPSRRTPPGSTDAESCCEHTTALAEATGVRPVKEVERLFMSHYTPLLEAVATGREDAASEDALAAWSGAFEKSYQDSFAAIRVTGRRPKMVLDAPDEAIRVGKMVGARSVQLVLVDAMRFGLGERVQRLLEASMGDIGSCVERQLLWSALPSVTAVQMQLLAKGSRGLRDIVPPGERDLTAFRDGTACIPRRERIGSRDVLKLDVVEARLRDSGGAYAERMDDLAEEIAEALVKIAEGLPPRTMMYVFGDHGFVLRSIAEGRTGRAEQGGSRPEEVLVPAYAWLVGGLH